MHALADNAEPQVRRAFIEAIARAKKGLVAGRIAQALRQGDLAEAYYIAERAWNESGEVFRAQFSEIVLEIMTKAARPEFMRRIMPVDATIRFDFSQSDALSFVQRFSADKVRQITNQTKSGIKAAITSTFTSNLGVVPAAEQIRDFIGLTDYQVGIVVNFRRKLIDLANEPLAGLDETFVNQMRRAFIRRDNLTAANIRKAVLRYRDRMIQDRSLSISRTETIDAAHEAQQTVWEEGMRQDVINADEFEVAWLTAQDERVCRICGPMDGRHRALDGVYDTGFQHPPAHVACRCSELLVRKRTLRVA